MTRSNGAPAKLSRRQFLNAAAAAASLSLLAACGATPTATPVPPTPVPPTATKPPAAPTAAPAAPATAPAAPAAATATTAPKPTTPPAAAPTTAPAAGPVKTGGIYYQAHAAYDDYCDFTGLNIQEVSALLGDPLIAFTSDSQKVVPALAERWEVAPDGKSWTFYLRKGVKWHDGQTFTAKDVLFTLSTAADSKTASGSWSTYLTRIAGYADSSKNSAPTLSGVKVVDDYTVRIDFSEPDVIFLKQLAYITMEPEHALAKIPRDQLKKDPFWSTSARVGTGPFKFSKLVPDQRLELVANPDYWRGKPRLDGITHVFTSATLTGANALAAFQKGELHYVGIGFADIATVKAFPHTVIVPSPYWLYRQLIFNTKHGKIGDKRFRQAVAYAIDRKAMIEQLFFGMVGPRYSVWMQAQYDNASKLNQYKYDPAKAKALLKDLGWDANQEVWLVARSAGDQTALTAFQAYLGDVGIKVKAQVVDAPVYQNITWDTGQFDISYGSNIGNPVDPVRNAPSFLCAEKVVTGGNMSGYCNARVDELLKLASTEVDEAKRTPALQEASLILNDELPNLPLYDLLNLVAVDTRVVGRAESVGVTSTPYYYASELWWLNV